MSPNHAPRELLVVVLAGLPGTGKSTLARRLAQRLQAPLLDKDRVREALFGPHHVAYSPGQDDFCCEVLYRTVDHLEQSGAAAVVLDGRTYTRRRHVHELARAMQRPGRRLAVLLCCASDEGVRARLAADRERGLHPATNRDFELYARLKAESEPLQLSHLALDTEAQDLDGLERRCLDYLGPGGGV